MEIIPAILAEKFEDGLRMLKQAESFAHYVQIDLMDGIFVPSQSFPAEEISHLHTSLYFEIHLMAKDPLALMTRINHSQVKKAIFHFESNVNPLDFIKQMKEREITTGLAIKPETPIDKVKVPLEQVDTLLFLTVEPGYYGSPLQPYVLKKIEEARHLFQDKRISVDGGVSLDNLKIFFKMGVDSVCIGSRIFLNGDPKENYRKFTHQLLELEARKAT
jgi:ribulose-phosphate 3-epimerase